ncbi:MAG: cytochrome c peroxidase [Planctomycetota bacterium]
MSQFCIMFLLTPPVVVAQDFLSFGSEPPAYVEYAVENLPRWYKTPLLESADNTPKHNSISDAGAELGRALFYDPGLSVDNSVSCASCHRQENGFTDPRRFSRGLNGQVTERHSMALTNARFYENGRFFWDERAESLEHQVLKPIQDPTEMGSKLAQLVHELGESPEYIVLFRRAYGDPEITEDRIADALAQFIRAMVSYQSPYDQALSAAKSDRPEQPHFAAVDSIDDPELVALGEVAFRTNCAVCHVSAAQIATQPHNNGLAVSDQDVGAGNGRFKVPSLRNIGVRQRFMHDGRFTSLEEVVEFYADEIADDPNLSDHLIAGGLGTRIGVQKAIVAFMATLTDEEFLTSTLFADPYSSDSSFLRLDLSRDGIVDHADVELLEAAIGIRSPNRRFDLNGDGRIDQRDRKMLESEVSLGNEHY